MGALHTLDGFWYEFTPERLRVGTGARLIWSAPYDAIERVERGWAPGLQLGGPGMPGRGDEVRVRTGRTLPGFPWASMTPPDPEGFVARLSGLRRRTPGASPPEPAA